MSVDAIDATAEALPLELLNATNKELTAQLSRYEQLCDDKSHEIEDQRRRLQFVKEHLGNVRGEIVSTQSLSECKRREVESELHMYRLIERECGRMRQETSRLSTRRSGLQDALQAAQNRLFQENLRMEELREVLAVNQDELEQWDLARRQKEADEAAVARYAKRDEGHARQLTTQVERLEARLRGRQSALGEAVAAARGVQAGLDRAASDYRRLRADRGGLLAEWEEVVRAMHARDAAIRAAAAEYAAGSEWAEGRRRALRELRDALQAAQAEVAETNGGIREAEGRAARARALLAELTQHVAALEEEVDAARLEAARGRRDAMASRALLERAKAAVGEKADALRRAEERRAGVREAREAACGESRDLVAQRAAIDALLRDAKATDRRIEREAEDLKREQFTAGGGLHSIMTRQDELLAELAGGQALAKNLRAKISQLDGESFAQQKVLYNIEFNVQQMQRKVSRAKGERTEEERRRLNERIAALQSTLEELVAQQRALDTQVKRVREEARLAALDLIRLGTQRSATTDSALRLRLECDSCAAELRRLSRDQEDALVAADTQELQLQRLHRLLHDGGAAVAGLGARKEQLALDVSEREAEMAVHRDMLRLEAKVAEEERRGLVGELLDRRRALTAVRNRHSTVVGRLDPDEALRSQAERVIAAAKERETLQHRGDALDTRVRRLEKELAKLLRTLHVLRASNSNYRHMFDRVDPGHDASRTRLALQERQRELRALISRRTLEANDYQQLLHTRTEEAAAAAARQAQGEAAVKELQNEHTQTSAAILQGREAVIRYEQAIARARTAVAPEVAADVLLQERGRRVEAVLAGLLRVTYAQGEDAYTAARTMLIERRIPVETVPVA